MTRACEQPACGNCVRLARYALCDHRIVVARHGNAFEKSLEKAGAAVVTHLSCSKVGTGDIYRERVEAKELDVPRQSYGSAIHFKVFSIRRLCGPQLVDFRCAGPQCCRQLAVQNKMSRAEIDGLDRSFCTEESGRVGGWCKSHGQSRRRQQR